MTKPLVINVFAVKYDDAFIASVQAVSDEADGREKYLELSRQQLREELTRGAIVNAIGCSENNGVVMGRIQLVKVGPAEYFTIDSLATGLDDLGDLPGY